MLQVGEQVDFGLFRLCARRDGEREQGETQQAGTAGSTTGKALRRPGERTSTRPAGPRYGYVCARGACAPWWEDGGGAVASLALRRSPARRGGGQGWRGNGYGL
ncbi:hypothetical protein GCM10025795_43830 [Verticiella sediminum]